MRKYVVRKWLLFASFICFASAIVNLIIADTIWVWNAACQYPYIAIVYGIGCIYVAVWIWNNRELLSKRIANKIEGNANNHRKDKSNDTIGQPLFPSKAREKATDVIDTEYICDKSTNQSYCSSNSNKYSYSSKKIPHDLNQYV